LRTGLNRPLLTALGWGPSFEEALGPLADTPGELGRVQAQHRGGYEILTEQGLLPAIVEGKTMRGWEGASLPIVGDWVLVERLAAGGAVVRAILPRRSKLARRAAGGGIEEQALVANVEIALVVTSLEGDFSPRRLERYTMMAREGGVTPVIALSKADLCPDPAPRIAEAQAAAPGARVLLLSARQGEGVDAVRGLLREGETLVLLGSSGVGKSTLLNALLGREEIEVGEVRADGKGRHTTTHRHLVQMPGGGVLIDTPGMRELGVLAAEEQAFDAFEDLDALIEQCRFSDCQHRNEPGCALQGAIAAGQVTEERLRAYLKMRAEADWVAAQRDARARQEAKGRAKKLSREVNAALRRKGRI
jgi:ribosome biogenesis GTPase